MEAGYLVAKYIKSKLSSMGVNSTIAWLASKIGSFWAKKIVMAVVQYGVTAAASMIAGWLSINAALAGPLGFIVGLASGWL